MSKNIVKIKAKPTLPRKKNVAAYCRVSVSKDATLHSLAAQVSYYQEYISNNPDWIFAGIYADEGISGTKVNRPEFQRMIEDCKQGKIDMIITKSISRFARNTMLLLETTRLLKSLNIDVYFEEQKMHSLSSDGELMLSLLAGFAEEEVISMSNNVRWKVNKFFEEGKVWGIHDIYGYKASGDSYEIVDEQAKVIRRIYDDYVNKKIGIQRITINLNLDKIPSPLGCRWVNRSVRHILRNPTYTGELKLGRYSAGLNEPSHCKLNDGSYPIYLVTDSHPAIISKDDYEKAQVLMKEKMPLYHKPGNNLSPFTKKIKCGTCGKNYIRKHSKYRTYWVCVTSSIQTKAGCEQTLSLREDTLYELTNEALGIKEFDEKLFDEKIEKIIVHPNKDVDFVFKTGEVKTLHYEFKSRKLSWTPEMKEEARRREMERQNGKNNNQD